MLEQASNIGKIRKVESRGYLAREFSDGATVTIPGESIFRAIFTRREYPKDLGGAVVLKKIDPDGTATTVVVYNGHAQRHTYNLDIWGREERTLVAQGETIVMECLGKSRREKAHSSIAEEFEKAENLAKQLEAAT